MSLDIPSDRLYLEKMVFPYAHPWKSTSLGILLGLAILAIAYTVVDEDALQWATRWTGRASAVLFLPVFAARPLVDLLGNERVGVLVRHRSGIGLILAGNHHVHMVLLTIYLLGEGAEITEFLLNPGLYIYVVLIAMNVTSFPKVAAKISRSAVRWIHLIGIYALAIAFFETLILSQLTGEETGAFRFVYGIAFAICLIVRLCSGIRHRQARTQ